MGCCALLWLIYLCSTASGDSHEITSTIEYLTKGLLIAMLAIWGSKPVFTVFISLHWGSRVFWVWNVVEVALSTRQPNLSPLQKSLFDEGRGRWKHILYNFSVLKHMYSSRMELVFGTSGGINVQKSWHVATKPISSLDCCYCLMKRYGNVRVTAL